MRAVISGLARLRASAACFAGTGLTGRSGLSCRLIFETKNTTLQFALISSTIS
nr:MAG TPA: hypothetical protein [Bacteriophage sp.]